MTIAAKSADNMQVFRGSRPAADVFAQNAGVGCCDTGSIVVHDKLAPVVHFDNALAHLNPAGANDKFRLNRMVPGVVDHINAIGVGAQVSVLAIPTGAIMRAVAVRVDAEDTGLVFELQTRNGLVLPTVADDAVLDITAAAGAAACDPATRVMTPSASLTPWEGIGPLGANSQVDKLGLYSSVNPAAYSLESDELMLVVTAMPGGGIINGDFDITVSAVYDIALRA